MGERTCYPRERAGWRDHPNLAVADGPSETSTAGEQHMKTGVINGACMKALSSRWPVLITSSVMHGCMLALVGYRVAAYGRDHRVAVHGGPQGGGCTGTRCGPVATRKIAAILSKLGLLNTPLSQRQTLPRPVP